MYTYSEYKSEKIVFFVTIRDSNFILQKCLNEFLVRWFLMKKERKFNVYDLGFKEVCTKILTLIFYNTLLQLGNKLLVSGSGLFFLVYVLIRVSLGNLQTLTAVRWQDSMSQNCVDFFRICGELQKKVI